MTPSRTSSPHPVTSPVVRVTLLLLALLVVLTGLAPAPAEAAGAGARIAKLQASVKNARAASVVAHDALAAADGEAAPLRDRAAQAARRSEAADAAVLATAEAARNAAAGLAAAQAAAESARGSADAAAEQATDAAGRLTAARQGYESAVQARDRAAEALQVASQAVANAQKALDDEKAKWYSCTHSSGAFMCRRNHDDAYQPVPKLDQLLDAREAAQRQKDTRYHELDAAVQVVAQWADRVQQAAAALSDAQAVAAAAADARDRAQASQVAALAKRDETAAASARATSDAASARATADSSRAEAERAQVGVDRLRRDADAALAKLTRAKQHLRYVRRQLARRR